MIKLIQLFIIALLNLFAINTFASYHRDPLKDLDSQQIVQAYLEAITQGKTNHSKYLFANDFQYESSTNKINYSKVQFCQFLQVNKGIHLDCQATAQILDATSNTCIAKTSMTFANFTRVDYITLSRHRQGWKISKIITTYP